MVLSNYNYGWREEFRRYPGMKLEYTPLDLMWKAAKYSGLSEHYPHFFAKSGYFAFFLYDIDQFWIYDIFRVPLVENSLNACNVQRNIMEPHSPDEAVSFIKEMIDSGNLVWATNFEPMLIYGFEGHSGSERLYWYNPNVAPDGITWGRDEVLQWWQLQENIGQHILISPVRVVPGVNSDEEIAIELMKLVVQNAQNESIQIGDSEVPLGLNAYDKYIQDLRNPDVDFLKKSGENETLLRTAWFSFAIYSQWTQYFAAHSFFSHIANSFNPDEQKIVQQIADYYGDAFGHWIRWEKIIGRTPDEDEFLRRIGSQENRIKSAECVENAKESIAKAVELQMELLQQKNISLETEQENENEQ